VAARFVLRLPSLLKEGLGVVGFIDPSFAPFWLTFAFRSRQTYTPLTEKMAPCYGQNRKDIILFLP